MLNLCKSRKNYIDPFFVHARIRNLFIYFPVFETISNFLHFFKKRICFVLDAHIKFSHVKISYCILFYIPWSERWGISKPIIHFIPVHFYFFFFEIYILESILFPSLLLLLHTICIIFFVVILYTLLYFYAWCLMNFRSQNYTTKSH